MNPSHYDIVAAAIRYLDAHHEAQPGLAELAKFIGYSEGHLQRVFTEWAGISPKRFLQALTRSHARSMLTESLPSLDTALATGLSSGGRLHDLFVECEGVTPGEVARLGRDLTLSFGCTPTLFGDALLAWSSRGLCHLRFFEGDEASAINELRTEWPNATLERDEDNALRFGRRIFPSGVGVNILQVPPIRLWLKGTNFQYQVWQALLRIPEGRVMSYGTLAKGMQRPTAARAVGNAVGSNPVAWLIPCHRVIRETGALGAYRWGLTRKQAMLARESRPDPGEASQEGLVAPESRSSSS